MTAKFIKAVDHVMARFPSFRGDGERTLLILAFHAVLNDIAELESDALDPYQPITVADLRNLVAHLQARGFRFVTGRDLAGTACTGRCVWLTFDDGYANNLRLLPLLEKMDVKATIFVSSGMVDRAEGYWWDTLWRLRRAEGVHPAAIATEREMLKRLPGTMLGDRLRATFGAALDQEPPDLARPLRPAELRDLADCPLVEIGNHTHDHFILPAVSEDLQHEQIALCQERLTAIGGMTPISIAYPNGDTSAETIRIARNLGLRVGVTCLPARQDSTAMPDMAMGRFAGFRNGRMQRELRLALAPLSLVQRRAAKARARLLNVS